MTNRRVPCGNMWLGHVSGHADPYVDSDATWTSMCTYWCHHNTTDIIYWLCSTMPLGASSNCHAACWLGFPTMWCLLNLPRGLLHHRKNDTCKLLIRSNSVDWVMRSSWSYYHVNMLTSTVQMPHHHPPIFCRRHKTLKFNNFCIRSSFDVKFALLKSSRLAHRIGVAFTRIWKQFLSIPGSNWIKGDIAILSWKDTTGDQGIKYYSSLH